MWNDAGKLIERIRRADTDRTGKAVANIITMLFLKGANVAVSLLYVPLLIHTLDVEMYGIWITLTSLVTWLSLIDAGVENGLRNLLSESLASNDLVQSKVYISTAYFVIGVFSIILLGAILLVSRHIEWASVLNIDSAFEETVSKLALIVFVMFVFQYFFKIINAICFALQYPAIAALLNTSSQLLSFVLVYVLVSYFDITDIVILGAIIAVTPVLVLLLGTFVIFFIKRKDLRPSLASINLSYLHSILGVGIKFFFLQIITILFYQSSNIIIAQTLDQARVAEFNIALKYIGIISMLFTIVVTPYWSSATESYHKGDLMWINRSVINLRKVLAVLTILGLILISVSSKLYTLWIGESIKPDTVLLSLLLLYFCTNMYYSLHGYILNGIGKVQLQLIVTSLLALGFIPIAIILTSNYGLYGLVSALTVVSVGNAAWSSLQYQKVISGRATGIFNK